MREDDILSNLNKYFHYEALRPGQLPIIEKILENRDVIVCKETGFGKSLCFQLAGMMREGLVVVFSNLTSRVERKCEELSSKKVKCTCSITHAKDLRDVLKKRRNKFWDDLHCIKTSGLKFLYITLNYFKESSRLREELENIYRKNLLQAIVIDEISYTSQWIDSFKCDYSELALLRDAYPNTPFLCFIGPTSQDKISIIKEILHLQNPYMLNEPSTKLNVSHQVMYVDEITLLRFVQFIKESYHKESGIVYCFNKEDCNRLVDTLKRNDVSSIYYTDKWTEYEKKWIKDRNKYGVVIVCLSGMPLNLNLEKIKFTIHMRIPVALDTYIAETNHVGQNGTPKNSIVLYSKHDSQHHLDLITNPYKKKIPNADTETKNLLLSELKVYRQELFEMTLFGENQSICRQVFMLKFLNDENNVEPCGICDVCRVMEESYVVDMSHCLKKILSAIWTINRYQKGVKSNDYVFASITFLIDLLLGRREESMKRLNVRLSDEWIFGSFGSWNANTLHTLIVVLLIQKLASINLVANDEFAVYQNLIITPKGQEFANSTNEFCIPFSRKDVKISKWLDETWVRRQLLNDLKAIVNYNFKHCDFNTNIYEKYCTQLSSHVPGTKEEFQAIKAWKMDSSGIKQPTKLHRKYVLQSLEGFKDDDIQYKRLMSLRYNCLKKFTSPAAEIGVPFIEDNFGTDELSAQADSNIESVFSHELSKSPEKVTVSNDNICSEDKKKSEDVAKRKQPNTSTAIKLKRKKV